MQPNTDPVYLASQELSKTTLQRFLKKIRVDPETGCWIWTACLHHGYGQMSRGIARSLKAPITAAHIISYILYKGPIPEGMLVLHKCPGKHNRACVCPDHLKLGNKRENGQDSIDQGTNSFCVNKAIRLSLVLAEEIRSKWIGYRGQQTELAKEYVVSRHTISLIVKNRTWRPRV